MKPVVVDALLQVASVVPDRSAVGGLAILALPLPIVAPETTLTELDEVFRTDSELRGVLTRAGDRWQLVDRTWFEHLMSGRLGYGRALAVRRRLADLLPLATLTVSAHTSLDDAARAVLSRTGSRRFNDVVIDAGDTAMIVPVAALFAGLSGVYRQAAYTDALTGMPNRLAITALINEPEDIGPERQLAVLYVDLDRFKDVNDTYGHRIGDELLVEFSRRLQDATRPGDLVARLGGDEFMVVLADVGERQAVAISERIVLSAASPFIIDGHVITIGASVGLAMPGDAPGERYLSATEVLLRHADAAMYRAKDTGRGRWARLGPTGIPVEPALGRRLRAALDSGLLELHYQPKLTISDGRTVEFEALCRWTDPELGVVGPATFIPVAERTGLIAELGLWVLRTACQQGRRWLDDGHDVGVAVNISPAQLIDDQLVTDVATVLADTGLPSERLRLEITETAAIADLAATARRLSDIRHLGVRLSLDDFGTGYSSLSLLRALPVHDVKIDKSFIDHLTDDDTDAALVAMIIDGAHRLGLTVTAEGVEHLTQLNALRDLGCDAAQGYLLGRPTPADLIELPRSPS
jgi:diguanylate cyclase (GGDEF)-like protein